MKLTIYHKIIIAALVLFVIYMITKKEEKEKAVGAKNNDDNENENPNDKHPYDPVPEQNLRDNSYTKNRLQKSELIGQSYATK